MTETQIIQQLWQCLDKGYTYDQAKTHIKAFSEGKTTVIKQSYKLIDEVVVIEK